VSRENEPLKIVQVCPFFAPHVGGVESHVAMVSTELARRGHHVTVLTSRHVSSLPEMERDQRGFDIVRTPSLTTVLATPITLRVGRTLRSVDGDVFHLHYPPPLTSYFASRALRHKQRPVCLTYHCDLDLEGITGFLLAGIYQKLFLPPTMEVADRVIVHTGSYGKTSRYLRDVPLVVIPSLVDTARFQVKDDDKELRHALGADGKRVILFVGRLVPHKGVDDLIRAVPKLPEDVLLVVVGGGADKGALEKLAMELNVNQRVRFAGEVSVKDLPRYYNVSALFAFPSQNRLEGFGLAPIEAMASGRPVVVADMPGVREVVVAGEDGLLAQPLLPDDLAAKCLLLLNDPGRMKAMGAKGRENAMRKYSVSVVVDRLEQLYRELVSGAPAS
jgi:glycosyltransferase involved in cell wall biosynthesis